MKRYAWQIALGSSLIIVSTLIYYEQIRLFHAPRDTFFYLFQDLAFVPIQVLLVTLIVDRVLRIRERSSLLKKLNMVIGAFFSEVGTSLLRFLSAFDTNFEAARANLSVSAEWNDDRFSRAARDLKSCDYRMDCRAGDLAGLREFLLGRRSFLLGLLENPNLLEHESFTELLWAVFHLTEELAARSDVGGLSKPDCDHLAGDIRRASVLLTAQWLSYMLHLKKEYPYLFSLAVRTNPFDPKASAEVK
jgi:hypothetical protein